MPSGPDGRGPVGTAVVGTLEVTDTRSPVNRLRQSNTSKFRRISLRSPCVTICGSDPRPKLNSARPPRYRVMAPTRLRAFAGLKLTPAAEASAALHLYGGR